MKKFILAVALILSVLGLAKAGDYPNLLPYSNELNGSVLTSTAIPFAAVAVSSVAATRIDTALNASLATALGTNYKRAEIQVQVYDSASVKCNYSSTAVSTGPTGGFFFTQDAEPKTFALGKAIGIWCQGVTSTATFMVGGLGYK